MGEAEPAIRVLADYGCHALWVLDGGGYRNADPQDEEFGLSESLASDLNSWASDYNATYRDEDPLASGFDSPSAEREFVNRGRLLAERVRREVGKRWTVSYFDMGVGHDVRVEG